MELIFKSLLITSLIVVFYQDVKTYRVYWFLFPIILMISGYLFYTKTNDLFFKWSVITNLVIVLILLIVAWCYTKFKLKIRFSDVIGLGDVLLFLSLSFTFASMSFLTVFVFALFFSLVIHIVLKRAEPYVPLAGYMCLFFALTYMGYWAGLINQVYLI